MHSYRRQVEGLCPCWIWRLLIVQQAVLPRPENTLWVIILAFCNFTLFFLSLSPGQVVYAHQFVNLTGENLTDTSLFEEHLCNLLCDLTGLAMGKYSKVGGWPQRCAAFACRLFFFKLERAAVLLLNMFIRIFSIQLQLQMANIPSEY